MMRIQFFPLNIFRGFAVVARPKRQMKTREARMIVFNPCDIRVEIFLDCWVGGDENFFFFFF